MRDKFIRFMYGRYGFDILGGVLLIGGGILTSVFSFFDFFPLRMLGLPLYIFAVLRIFSKNTAKRSEENSRFIRLIDPLVRKISVMISHSRDSQHRYFTCPGCKKVLRVPRGRGKIKINCPHCHKEFVRKT